MTATNYNFSAVHAAMQRYVDFNILPGISSAVLVGRDLVDMHSVGWADKEQGIFLRDDHLFRIFSNSKLVTSIATLLLFEDGKFQLDDPIKKFIPQLGNRRVLNPQAISLDETESAHSDITIRQLLSHSSGLSYGLLDPGTLIFRAYNERKMLHPAKTLAEKMDALADLPLLFHPGTSWEYSIATDVLGRLVEIVSGERLDVFFKSRIFDPLGMKDTGFVIPEDQQHRLATLYSGMDVMNPMLPGLIRSERLPFPNANLQSVPFLSGGGGLVSSLPDMVALIRSLLLDGETLLKPETIRLMMTNQLSEGSHIRFHMLGEIHGKGFGLGGAVTMTPSSIDPALSVGEFQWGGLAGTHWWISPKQNLAGILMTQRWFGFWNPFSFELKQRIYEAALP